MNESHWLGMADAMNAGKTKIVTVQDAAGNPRQAVNYNGTLYNLNTIPYASPANASRAVDVPAIMPKGSPYTPGAPTLPSASVAASSKQPTPGYPSVSPALQRTRDTERVRMLNDELTGKQTDLAAASDPKDQSRIQGDIAAIKSEIGTTQRVNLGMTPATAPQQAVPSGAVEVPSNGQQPRPGPAYLDCDIPRHARAAIISNVFKFELWF